MSRPRPQPPPPSRSPRVPPPRPAGAARRRAAGSGSPLQPQGYATDRDLVTGTHALPLLDADAVHERAVGASGILDPPLAVMDLERRVARGGGLVRHGNVVPRVAPQGVRSTQSETLADPRRPRRAALDDERAHGARTGAFGLHGARQRAEGADQEEVQQEQKGDADTPEE